MRELQLDDQQGRASPSQSIVESPRESELDLREGEQAVP